MDEQGGLPTAQVPRTSWIVVIDGLGKTFIRRFVSNHSGLVESARRINEAVAVICSALRLLFITTPLGQDWWHVSVRSFGIVHECVGKTVSRSW